VQLKRIWTYFNYFLIGNCVYFSGGALPSWVESSNRITKNVWKCLFGFWTDADETDYVNVGRIICSMYCGIFTIECLAPPNMSFANIIYIKLYRTCYSNILEQQFPRNVVMIVRWYLRKSLNPATEDDCTETFTRIPVFSR